MSMKRDYQSVRDGMWAAEDGATIHKVSPRGLTLYAVRLPGSKRPVWVDTLAEAKEIR
jgi:hypothetical protein